jgi:hypothetical protein
MGISLQLPQGSPWRTVLRVCILLLAEAAVIAMLRDAPLVVLAATVVIALLALAVLELEVKISALGRWIFIAAIAVLGITYLGFAGYAINHAHQQNLISEKLESLRSRGLVLQQRPELSGMNAFEYADWQKQIAQWRDDTADYLERNLGVAAKTRFLITAGRLSFSYGSNQQLNQELNTTDGLGKNLQDVIDSRRPH